MRELGHGAAVGEIDELAETITAENSIHSQPNVPDPSTPRSTARVCSKLPESLSSSVDQCAQEAASACVIE